TLVRNCYGLSGCWPPCTDLTGLPANRAFASRLSTGRSPSPSPDMTTTAALPPAGMAASLATLVRPCSLHCQRVTPGRGCHGTPSCQGINCDDIDFGNYSLHVVGLNRRGAHRSAPEVFRCRTLLTTVFCIQP